MYKDPNKQREAVKEAARRYRARLKGITYKVSQDKGITSESHTPNVIPIKRFTGELTKEKQTSQKRFNKPDRSFLP